MPIRLSGKTDSTRGVMHTRQQGLLSVDSFAVNSLNEGQIVINQERGRQPALVLKKNNRLYKSYLSADGNNYVEKDLEVKGSQIINSDLTVGRNLSVDQGTADDSLLTLKSTGDVTHGITDYEGTTVYGAFRKAAVGAGGLKVRGLRDADSNNHSALFLEGVLGEAVNTDKDATSRGVVRVSAKMKSGTGVSGVTANGNLFSVDDNNNTRLLVDEDGDIYYDGATPQGYDSYDDAMLIRTMDSTMASQGVIQNEFDSYIKYNKKTLVDAGLLGSGDEPLVCLTGMQRLHNGAIWQQYTESQRMKKLMYETMVEMIGKEKADIKFKNCGIKLLDKVDTA